MPYVLDPAEPLEAGIRRVAMGEVDGALESLAEVASSGHEDAVHDVRKRAKKLRALARLVRDEIGEEAYHRTNDPVRDAARALSGSRDAQVLVESFDDLLVWMDRDRRSHRSVWAELERRAEAAAAGVSGHDGHSAGARRTFERLHREVGRWRLSDDVEVLLPGTARVYRRGRRGYRDACREPTVEALHEWRKRAKYLWYHLRLLAPAAPDVLGPLRDVLDELADLLGDDHDLAVLVDVVRADPAAFGGDGPVATVVTAAGARRAELQLRAWDLGRQVYAESPSRFTDRLGAYWAAGADGQAG